MSTFVLFVTVFFATATLITGLATLLFKKRGSLLIETYDLQSPTKDSVSDRFIIVCAPNVRWWRFLQIDTSIALWTALILGNEVLFTRP